MHHLPNTVSKLARIVAAAAVAGLAAPAAAQEVSIRLSGHVSSLAPAPTSGPFLGASVGEAVTLDLVALLPGSPHPQFDARGYSVDPSRSVLRVGSREDSFALAGSPSLGVWNDYLGLRDWFQMFNDPLSQGGLVRFDLLDGSRAVFDSSQLELLRGTYSAAQFSTTSFGAQVGGGFLEFSFDELIVGNGGIGEVYCAPAIANSTGSAALLQVIGSAALSANSLTLQARRLPTNTFGFFLVSATQASVPNPGGSQGRLCLGGAIGRYQASVLSSGASGFIELAVAPLALPQPTGPVAAQAGETWNFQAWYRDANPLSTSNFTDAVAVTFQ